MDTVLTPRLLFDDVDAASDDGWYGMVRMTDWRVAMLAHVAQVKGRPLGLSATLPRYAEKGIIELSTDGRILAGSESLMRLVRRMGERDGEEMIPVFLHTDRPVERDLGRTRIKEIGERFQERYIDPLVVDSFPVLKDARNTACAVRAYINWIDFGLPGMLRRNGWPVPSRLISVIRDNYDDIVRYHDWAAVAKARYHLGLRLPLALMLVQRHAGRARMEAFWEPVFVRDVPLDPDSPQAWMLDEAARRAAADGFDQHGVLSLLVSAWNRWMHESVGDTIPLGDEDDRLLF